MADKIRKIKEILKWKPSHRQVRKYGRHIAQFSINLFVNLASILHATKFSKNSDGVYRVYRRWWRRALHGTVIFSTLLLTAVHSSLAVSEVGANGLTISSLFALTYAIIYATVSIMMVSLSLWAHEVADWWNAATSILDHLTKEAGTLVSPLNTYKTMMEVIPNVCFAYEGFSIVMLQSLIYTDVTSHLATALESRLVLPKVEIFGVGIPWRVICLPAEFLHNAIPSVIVTLCAIIIPYGLATNATIVSFLRSAPITLAVERKKMHGLYMSLQLYNQLLGQALCCLLPCCIFLVMTSCTYSLYLTIVATQLPPMLHILCPMCVAISFMITVIISEDATLVGNGSESVIDNLRAYDIRCVSQRGKDYVRLYSRQAIIYRRINIKNGLFGTLQPNLPARVAEETINQLLLLLTF